MAAPQMVGLAEQQPEADGAASKKIAEALGTLGVTTVSTATTLAAEFKPGGLVTDNLYHLALAGTAFLGGVTLIGASVWVSDNPATRHGAGKKLLYSAVPPLLAAVGVSVAALLG